MDMCKLREVLFAVVIFSIVVKESKQDSSIHSLEALKLVLKPLLTGDDVDQESVLEALQAYTGEDLDNYITFNDDGYTYNLIDDADGQFNIVILGFSGGQSMAIHDHHGGYSFNKVIDGAMLETVYKMPTSQGQMEAISTSIQTSGTVTVIHDDFGLVHGWENLSPENTAITFHINYPPFDVYNEYNPDTGASTVVVLQNDAELGQPTGSN